MTKLLSLITLIFLVGATPACGAVAPFIAKVLPVVTNAINTLDIIDNAAQEYFRTNPDTPEEVRARYATAYAKTVAALNAAQAATQGAGDLDQEQYDAAFAEFKRAYLELKTVLEKDGLMQGGKMSSGGEPVEVPEPDALSLKL